MDDSMDLGENNDYQNSSQLLSLQQLALFRLDNDEAVKQLLVEIDAQLLCCWDDDIKQKMIRNLMLMVYELSKMIHN